MQGLNYHTASRSIRCACQASPGLRTYDGARERGLSASNLLINLDNESMLNSTEHLEWRSPMGRKCQLTGKKANNAYAISHSHIRTKKLQEPNLQWKRVWWPQGKRWVKLQLSTKAIKTLGKKGLTAFAKEAGIDLNRF